MQKIHIHTQNTKKKKRKTSFLECVQYSSDMCLNVQWELEQMLEADFFSNFLRTLLEHLELRKLI